MFRTLLRSAPVTSLQQGVQRSDRQRNEYGSPPATTVQSGAPCLEDRGGGTARHMQYVWSIDRYLDATCAGIWSTPSRFVWGAACGPTAPRPARGCTWSELVGRGASACLLPRSGAEITASSTGAASAPNLGFDQRWQRFCASRGEPVFQSACRRSPQAPCQPPGTRR